MHFLSSLHVLLIFCVTETHIRSHMDLDFTLCHIHANVGWSAIGSNGTRKNTQTKTYGLGQG